MVDRFYPGRSAELRPDDKQEIKATSVIAMKIEQASVKIRAKGVGDNPEDISFPAWAGVIPIRQEIGADEPCQHNQTGMARPASLNSLRAGRRLDEALIEAQRNYENLRS